MAIASLYPTIKPSLLLDFANSKKLDPRVTFSRSTTATYYDGVTTAKAEENLLLNSVGPLNPGWGLVNGYAGTQSAELLLNSTSWTGASGITPPDDWTAPLSSVDSTYTVAGGVLTITNGTGGSRTILRQAISVTPGAYYQVTVKDLSNGTAGPGSASVRIADTDSTSDITPLQFGEAAGTQYQSFIATTSTIYVFLGNYSFTNGVYISVDDISIKQLTADNVTAPDGTATAVTATADAANATYRQSVTAIAAQYTFSVYLRRVTGTGDIDITCDSAGTWVTQSITSSWARYTVTQTLTAGTRTPGIRIVTSGDQIEVWGAQFEQRSAATAYTPTTTQAITNYVPQLLTAPAGVPRFDHNPTTGESLGLLVEPQKTNLLQYSTTLDLSFFTFSGGTRVASATVAPDGTLTASLYVENTSNTDHRIFTGSMGPGTGTRTLSAFVKANGRNWFSLSANTANTACWFDLSTGQKGTVGSAASSTIQNVGNGWYRVSITFTGSYTDIYFSAAASNGGGGYTGNGVSGFFIWGVQFENSDFTSFIATASASVTRTADAASMTGANFSVWDNAAEGAIYTETIFPSTSAASGVVLNDGTTSNRIRLAPATVSDQATVTTSGTAQAVLDAGTPVAGAVTRLAMAYAVNDFALSLNGGAVATDTSGTVPVVNQFQIGAETTAYGNVRINKIAYYPERLTNAQLQALTA